MKLWLLDADVIIKLLEIDVFDRLVDLHEVHVASAVVDEVKYFKRDGKRVQVAFENEYIQTGRIVKDIASPDEIKSIITRLPRLRRDTLHTGELESLAILTREESVTMCTFDAAAIKTLPFLGASDRAVSAERLLHESGLTLSPKHTLDPRLTDAYFKSNLEQGRKDFLIEGEFK